MKHTPGTDFVREWLEETEDSPSDPVEGTRRAMSHLDETKQASRWWPVPVLYRSTETPARPATTTDTTEYQPDPIPATNGRFPTVIGRTSSMLSPVKAITAGAVVFAVGAAFLIAQPFQQQASVPGAETVEFVEPVEFTAILTPGPWVTSATCDAIGGTRQCQGEAWSPAITEVSDPRLDGEMTLSADQVKWPGQQWLVTETYRITNEDGAWQGSFPSIYESDGRTSRAATVVLVGEGDYEGLYAWMDVTDWSTVSGVVFSYPPPEAPAPPSAE